MKKSLVVLFSLAMLVTARAASAATVTLGVGAGGAIATDHILGEVFQPGDLSANGQLAEAIATVNAVLALSAGTRAGTSPEVYRAANSGGTYPALIQTGATLGGPSNLTITLASAFTYLVINYDGPNNGGAEVYYIAGLSAGDVINFPAFAHPDNVVQGTPCGGTGQASCGNLAAGTYYGMTNWTLINPTTSVPDGGLTATLLGMGMVGLGLVRRRFRS